MASRQSACSKTLKEKVIPGPAQIKLHYKPKAVTKFLPTRCTAFLESWNYVLLPTFQLFVWFRAFMFSFFPQIFL